MMNRLAYKMNYIWRIVATGICFIVFGIGGACLGYIILPIIKFTSNDAEHGKYRARYIIHLSFRLFVFMMGSLGLVSYKFKGFEKLNNDKGCLIVSNHPTLIDYVVIVSKLKRCDTIVKGRLWDNPFLKNVVRAANYIPNRQSEETFELIKSTLRKGNNLLIFPEVTRTTTQQPMISKRGAALISIRAQAPIRVLSIDCYPNTLTKQNKWYEVAKKKPIFAIEVGELIDPSKFLKDTDTLSITARRLTRYIKNTLEGGSDNGRF